MSTTTKVPVTITPEAAALVAELGRQAEFEQMLEHTRQSVPNLHSIEVVRYDDPEGDDSRVRITAWIDEPWRGDISVHTDWGKWFVTTFPPEVCRYFGFSTRYRGGNATKNSS
jgi:hypothetical protein